MAVQAKTTLFIDGKQITNFKSYTLDQFINDHHTLEISCRMDALDNLSESLANSSKNFLGKTVLLEITSNNIFENYKPLQFKGVVVKVSSIKGINDRNEVIITAYSPTIVADDGPHYASYCDTTLDDMVQSSLKEYDQSKLKTVIKSQNSNNIVYSVQHNESNWQYVSRLAQQYGQWLYYNGQDLVFGTPEDKEEVQLTQGKDLLSFSLELLPLPNRFNFFTGDYAIDELHEKKSDDVNTGVNGFHNFTSNVSKDLYSKETRVWVNQVDNPEQKSQLNQHIELRKKVIEQQQFSVAGISNNPGVMVGQKINITTDGLSEGSFRVTKVSHFNNSNGNYQNTFEAISSQTDIFPDTNVFAFPKSESQVAVVTENADPDGLGRIKVQFSWQKQDGEMTSWLRVLTPHSGGEKGFHFIPEIGEEVLIGFEGGNAERPYVMGSLYNGNAKPEGWKTEKNDIKAIRTRSGHTLSFSDESGGESITITDKNGNSIVLDTANSTISISAPDAINLSSKEININASDAINIDGTNKVNVTSKEIVNDGSAKVIVNSKTKVEVGAPSTLVVGKAELKLTSKGMTDIDGTTMTNVKGGLLNLNCG